MRLKQAMGVLFAEEDLQPGQRAVPLTPEELPSPRSGTETSAAAAVDEAVRPKEPVSRSLSRLPPVPPSDTSGLRFAAMQRLPPIR
ncbi:MAG: hypothetical protein ACC628_06850 [Pirellulaceae bacterium]